MGRSERIRARFRLGQLCEQQVQWLSQRGYQFDVLGEKQAQREQLLELARRHYGSEKAEGPLAQEESALLARQVKSWLRGLMGGELSSTVRETLAPLGIDWRFSELVFEREVFSRWAADVAKAQASPEALLERHKVWLSFARQSLQRRTMPKECVAVMKAYPGLLPSDLQTVERRAKT